MKSINSYIFKAFIDWLDNLDVKPRLTVDASVAGVKVPRQYVQDGRIVVSLYRDYINNLRLTDNAISFTTKFHDKEELVIVPYNAMLELFCSYEGCALPIGQWLSFFDSSAASMFVQHGDLSPSAVHRKTQSSSSAARSLINQGRDGARKEQKASDDKSKDDNKAESVSTIIIKTPSQPFASSAQLAAPSIEQQQAMQSRVEQLIAHPPSKIPDFKDFYTAKLDKEEGKDTAPEKAPQQFVALENDNDDASLQAPSNARPQSYEHGYQEHERPVSAPVHPQSRQMRRSVGPMAPPPITPLVRDSDPNYRPAPKAKGKPEFSIV